MLYVEMLYSLVNDISDQEISEWLDQDFDDPGYQYLYDIEIIEHVSIEKGSQLLTRMTQIAIRVRPGFDLDKLKVRRARGNTF